MEGWQGRQIVPLALRTKQSPEGSFHQVGHRSALPLGLALELRHDGVVDI